MLYKTMVLEILKERTQLYEQLCLARQFKPTLETLGQELKASHQTWKATLAQAKPGSHPNQIASEAMELALQELQERLPPVFPPDNAEPLSLDQAMAYVKNHTSNE